MAFAEDQEDVVSMSLTVVQSLMEKYGIQANAIGRSVLSKLPCLKFKADSRQLYDSL